MQDYAKQWREVWTAFSNDRNHSQVVEHIKGVKKKLLIGLEAEHPEDWLGGSLEIITSTYFTPVDQYKQVCAKLSGGVPDTSSKAKLELDRDELCHKIKFTFHALFVHEANRAVWLCAEVVRTIEKDVSSTNVSSSGLDAVLRKIGNISNELTGDMNKWADANIMRTLDQIREDPFQVETIYEF